jgi:hypothetical protein
MAGEMFDRPWTKERDAGRGALVHIEDSPFDLAIKLKLKSEGDRRRVPWSRALTLPDWQVDQLLAIDRLWVAAGDRSDVLMNRARAVLAHLDELEAALPLPPELTDRDDLALQASMIRTGRWMGAESELVHDQEAAWSLRTRKSVLVDTKLSPVAADEAMNLVLHGYYLAMANLHVCAGWPLTADLDRPRLEALFDGVPSSPLAAERRASSELAGALMRLRQGPVRPFYPLLSLCGVVVKFRDAGRSHRRVALVAMGIAESGAVEPLGVWTTPDLLGEEQERAQRRGSVFWDGVFGDLKKRVGDVRYLARDLPLRSSPTSLDSYDGCDAAARAAFPSAVMKPRISGVIDQSFSMLSASLAEMEAREELERFVQRWGEQGAAVRERWLLHWGEIAEFFDGSLDLQAALREVDTAVESRRQSLKDVWRERGPAASADAALGRLCLDLETLGPARPIRAVAALSSSQRCGAH